jgi:RHS repeat-associated protein
VGPQHSYYLLDDLLGSVRSVTTSTVTTVFTSNYKPYGTSYDLTLSLPSTFYFYYNHKMYDSTTGLYYYGARYYSPSINRFISEDELEYSTITNPITLNQYVYALKNPETNSDPSGHFINMWGMGDSNPEQPAPPPAK